MIHLGNNKIVDFCILISWTILSFFIFSFIYNAWAGIVWEDVGYGIRERRLTTVAVDSNNPNTVYAGSTKAVYKSTDGGSYWKEVLRVNGSSKRVNSITLDYLNSDIIYVATQDGLFKSEDGGVTWDRTWEGMGQKGNNILWATIHPKNPQIIYIGTEKDLFVSKDRANTWKNRSENLGNVEVRSVIIHPMATDTIYLVTNRGVFKTTTNGENWDRIFVYSSKEIEDFDLEDIDQDIFGEEGEEIYGGGVNCLAIDHSIPETVYIGSDNGIFVSRDGSNSWERLTNIGLINPYINSILIHPENSGLLYVATKEGIFEFSIEKRRWSRLYQGIVAREINHLAFGIGDSVFLWVATDNGMFKSRI